MVYTLLIVMLALLGLGTSTQRLNSVQDLYKYEFMNHQGKRQYIDTHNEEYINPETGRHYEDKTTNHNPITSSPVETYPKEKRLLAQWDLMNLLHYLPGEEISEVIFVPEELEYALKTE